MKKELDVFDGVDLSLDVKKIYSSYPTSNGVMYYVKTNKGDVFLHIFHNKKYQISNGYDGGDLSKYKKHLMGDI